MPVVMASLESALAAPRTPLVGRVSDIAAISRWLDDGERLVTITGPVGIGKTRVALEIARRCDVATTVVWVELGHAHDEAGLVDAVGDALGLCDEDGAGEPLSRIGRALRSRGDLLLVLDGLDGLAARAESTIAPWLATAPELLIVSASRERARLPGEVVHELGPLPEAEDLFIACAQRIRAGYQPADAERGDVTAIARELEGVPLAIELAAARLSVMAPRALLHRLRTGAPGVRDALERALAGSWSSLDAEEQRALAMATVFRGGFTLEAAEAVLDLGTSNARPVIDVISGLRDKSLLFARDDSRGDTRLDMYRALSAYASQRLDELAGARTLAESRHAVYFADLARASLGGPSLAGGSADARAARDAGARAARDAGARPAPREQDLRTRVLAERDNLLALIERVARAGTVSARVAEPALRALLALAPVLFAHGPLRAYEVLVDPAIAATRGSGADPSLVAQVLLVRAALYRHRGAAARGARDLVNALSMARTIGSAPLEARATFELAHALDEAGDGVAAEEHFRRAAALYATSGARGEEGRALASLADLLGRTGRTDEARELLSRALLLHADDAEARADDLRYVGALELRLGRLAAARTTTEESLAASLTQGEGRGAGLARLQLGLVAQRAGDRRLARTSLEHAEATFSELGFEALAATAQGHLGIVAREDGKIAEAETRLESACAALRDLSRGAAASLFAEHLRALEGTGAARSAPPLPPHDALLVAPEGAWFRPARGARVGLERRRPLARITERLTVERLERPGAPLGSRVLQEAAWAGEKLVAAAGAHRVRVAISTLRKLGLPVVTGPAGYALDADVVLIRA